MESNSKPNVELYCVSTNDQMIQSNVVPPIMAKNSYFVSMSLADSGRSSTVRYFVRPFLSVDLESTVETRPDLIA